MRNKVVIGANFGDEGKGLMTDYFVSQFHGECFVVRFNGGAQAGHTVVTPEGERHKFSHFGSGSLLGAPTYLSRFFLVNPVLFMRELEEFNFLPVVYTDEDCLVSTPYDMHINQIIEASRGDKKHGSCGMGINETVVRSEKEEFCFRAKELRNSRTWVDKLSRIAQEYYPKRFEELGLTNPIVDHNRLLGLFNEFVGKVTICDHQILERQDLVFEGAQGLLLDQSHPYFPHVTRSNTGFQNVKILLEEMQREDDETEAVYVTRSYMTRHGRGPFPTEIDGLPYPYVTDDTNVDHEFQEHLRFGFIGLGGLAAAIHRDLFKNEVDSASIAITCLDQVNDGMMTYYYGPNLYLTTIESFLEKLRSQIDLPQCNIYTSFGKTRETITTR
jgi:adenylosuccinate synthase